MALFGVFNKSCVDNMVLIATQTIQVTYTKRCPPASAVRSYSMYEHQSSPVV